MKNIRVAENIKLVGIKNFAGKDKLIDYYVEIPGQAEKTYAFSRYYSDSTYSLCKAGIRLNELTGVRTRNTAIMALVKYTKFILPYLVDEYELPVAA